MQAVRRQSSFKYFLNLKLIKNYSRTSKLIQLDTDGSQERSIRKTRSASRPRSVQPYVSDLAVLAKNNLTTKKTHYPVETPAASQVTPQDIIDKAVEWSMNYEMSQVVETFIKTSLEDQRNKIMRAILPKLSQVVINPFGCSVVCSWIASPSRAEFNTSPDSVAIMQQIQDQATQSAIKFALNKYGSYFLVSCIEHGTAPQKASLFTQMLFNTFNHNLSTKKFIPPTPLPAEVPKKSSLSLLASNAYASHCVRAYLEHGTAAQKQLLIDLAVSKTVKFSMEKYGAHFLVDCLNKSTPIQRIQLIDQIIFPTKENWTNIMRLAKSMKKMEEFVPKSDTLAILSCHMDATRYSQSALKYATSSQMLMFGNLSKETAIWLAMNKYGSIWLEMYLESAYQGRKAAIIGELLHPTGRNRLYLETMVDSWSNVEEADVERRVFLLLATNKYGAHVLSMIVKEGGVEERSRILPLILANLGELSKHENGTHPLGVFLNGSTAKEWESILDGLEQEEGGLFALACDKYGRFLIHNLFECASTENKAKLYEFLISKLLRLSVDAMGSFFVVDLLKKCPPEYVLKIVNQILDPTLDNLAYLEKEQQKSKPVPNPLVLLAGSKSGGFVITRIMKKCRGHQSKLIEGELLLSEMMLIAKDSGDENVLKLLQQNQK